MKFLLLFALALVFSIGHPRKHKKPARMWTIAEVRAVHLRWIDRTGVSLFLRVCEIPGRCHTRPLPGTINEARITGLRAYGNYTLSLRRPNGRLIQTAFVTTLAYKATMPRCSLKYSEVVVTTGPYFGGKIAVEDSTNPLCILQGNQSLNKSLYALAIPHDICKSAKKHNYYETIIVVHENPDVITYNSRRFLLKCTIFPETVTVQASINLPMDAYTFKNEVFVLETHQDNQLADSRIQAIPKALATEKETPSRVYSLLNHAPAIIVAIGVLLCALGLLVFWKRLQRADGLPRYTPVEIRGYPHIAIRAVRRFSDI